jgi:hypothetical protein
MPNTTMVWKGGAYDAFVAVVAAAADDDDKGENSQGHVTHVVDVGNCNTFQTSYDPSNHQTTSRTATTTNIILLHFHPPHRNPPR